VAAEKPGYKRREKFGQDYVLHPPKKKTTKPKKNPTTPPTTKKTHHNPPHHPPPNPPQTTPNHSLRAFGKGFSDSLKSSEAWEEEEESGKQLDAMEKEDLGHVRITLPEN